MITTPISESPRPSSTPSSRPTLLASLRRSFAAKPKQELELDDPAKYVPRPIVISSLTTRDAPSHPLNVSRLPVSGRVRMSGSRLPSGYRPPTAPKTMLAIIPPASEPPPSEPQPAPRAPPPQLRTRLARLFPLHSVPTSSTPSSSTHSFPSSSSGTSESTSTCVSTPTTSQRQVRFSPSASITQVQEKSHVRSKSLQVAESLRERTKSRRWGKK